MAVAYTTGHQAFQIKTGFEDTQCVSELSDRRLLSGHQSTFKVWSPACFKLLHAVNLPIAGDISSMCQNPTDDRQLAVSVSSSVICYDCRKLSVPVQVVSYNTDEINQIAYHSTGAYICACDDAGEVKVIDTNTSSLLKTLTGHHSSLCTCAQFLPQMSEEAVTAGMDCKVVWWDFNCPRYVTETSTKTLCSEFSSENMFINPPMVYSLDVWKSNCCFACGLGNGVIVIYELRKEMKLKCMSSPHTSMVVSICCIEQQKNGKTSYYIVSGGNDCKIVLSEIVEEEGTFIKIISQMKHFSKINSISIDHVGNVIVADQTTFVTAYKLGI